VTTTHKYHSRRRLDLFNLGLLLVSIVSGLGAYVLIEQGMTALLLIPSVVAATIGATHLVKYQAPRD
jgi:hypothetical protein